jgi:hypothetical protein
MSWLQKSSADDKFHHWLTCPSNWWKKLVPDSEFTNKIAILITDSKSPLLSKTYSEFQIPSDWIELHPLIFLQVVSTLSSSSKNPNFYMIFYVKVGRSSFLRGASPKASIAHLCTPPRAPRLLLPPPTMSTFASHMVPGKPPPLQNLPKRPH